MPTQTFVEIQIAQLSPLAIVVMQNLLKPLLAIPVSVAFVDAYGYIARVDGESMKPTLNPRVNESEYVFLNKVILDFPWIVFIQLAIFSSPTLVQSKRL